MRDIEVTEGYNLVELSNYEYAVLLSALDGPGGIMASIGRKIDELERGRDDSLERAREASVAGKLGEYDAWIHSATMIYEPLIDVLNEVVRDAMD